MKEPEINKDVRRKFDEFESMELLVPSDKWMESLFLKADSVHQYAPKRFSSAGVTTLLLLLVLLNIGFILTTFVKKSFDENIRKNELLIISNELLVNPGSLNK